MNQQIKGVSPNSFDSAHLLAMQVYLGYREAHATLQDLANIGKTTSLA
ncbi:hypothetical protein [Propionivibrio sp.]|nr:hypothetical protein [Propionivibrio sp.]